MGVSVILSVSRTTSGASSGTSSWTCSPWLDPFLSFGHEMSRVRNIGCAHLARVVISGFENVRSLISTVWGHNLDS